MLGDRTLGYAAFRGNMQHISTGNLAGNDRVSIILMDYAHRTRLKILGCARMVERDQDPALIARLGLITVRAWNAASSSRCRPLAGIARNTLPKQKPPPLA